MELTKKTEDCTRYDCAISMIKKIKYFVLVIFWILSSCQNKSEIEFYALNKQFEKSDGFIKEMVLVENPNKNADSLINKIIDYQIKNGKTNLKKLIVEKNLEYVMVFYYKTDNTSPFINSKKDPFSLGNVYLDDFSETDFLGSVYINKCDNDKSKWISGANVEIRDSEYKIIEKKEKFFLNECK